MAEDTIVVKNVTLTKAELEAALAKLNAPAPTFKVFDILNATGTSQRVRGVLVVGVFINGMTWSVVLEDGRVNAYRTLREVALEWAVEAK